MRQCTISRATIGRLPLYLNYLKSLSEETKNVSATAIAKELKLGEVQVRKDLNSVSGSGKPKTGYETTKLISNLEDFLGFKKKSLAVIVGAGKLGRALLDYSGFEDFGITVAAAFDISAEAEIKSGGNKKIFPLKKLEGFCKEHDIRIGIITVPSNAAQTVCDILVRNGIKAILSFAPGELTVPPGIPVAYENMALSLAYLNNRISKGE